jgi:hypothetical protein
MAVMLYQRLGDRIVPIMLGMSIRDGRSNRVDYHQNGSGHKLHLSPGRLTRSIKTKHGCITNLFGPFQRVEVPLVALDDQS